MPETDTQFVAWWSRRSCLENEKLNLDIAHQVPTKADHISKIPAGLFSHPTVGGRSPSTRG